MKLIKSKDVYCNICGRKIRRSGGILLEDVFSARKEWGYFSHKDLQIHSFNVCEKCYNQLVSHFTIPVEVTFKKEVI